MHERILTGNRILMFLRSKKVPFLVQTFLFSKGFCGAKKFVYIVGGGLEWESAIEDYSDLVLREVGRDDSIVTYKADEQVTTKVKHMDFSKAVRGLRHDPKVTPEEGIKKTVEWMKKEYNTEV